MNYIVYVFYKTILKFQLGMLAYVMRHAKKEDDRELVKHHYSETLLTLIALNLTYKLEKNVGV